MRLYIICLIFNLASLQEMYPDVYSGEELEYVSYASTTLDLRGTIRQLFAVELGIAARGRNMICSPISAMMPLAKLVQGSRKSSKTEKELLTAIGLKKRSEVKPAYKKTLRQLRSLKGVEVSLASRIYVSNIYTLKKEFILKTQAIFGSSIEIIDTKNPNAVANAINEWVAVNTKQKIKKLVSPEDIGPLFTVVLVNAIYFQGTWAKPFKLGKLERFYTLHGDQMVPMMKVDGRFNYIQSDALNAQIIELPYSGEECALIIILPNKKDGLPLLLRTLKLSYDLLNQALTNMKPSKVDVTIPKFKIETSIDLLSFLRKMNMKYSLSAELSDLTKVVEGTAIHITAGIQKAIIEVDEKGTVAAAATDMIELVSLQIYHNKFRADRPFLFFIKSHFEQLFAGVLNTP